MHKQISILSIEFPLERTLLRYLLIALSILICAYLYFVASSVLHAIARKEALTKSVQLEGSIGLLEKEYFALSHTVTPQTAVSIGLAPVIKTNYIYRPGNVGEAKIVHNTAI